MIRTHDGIEIKPSNLLRNKVKQRDMYASLFNDESQTERVFGLDTNMKPTFIQYVLYSNDAPNNPYYPTYLLSLYLEKTIQKYIPLCIGNVHKKVYKRIPKDIKYEDIVGFVKPLETRNGKLFGDVYLYDTSYKQVLEHMDHLNIRIDGKVLDFVAPQIIAFDIFSYHL